VLNFTIIVPHQTVQFGEIIFDPSVDSNITYTAEDQEDIKAALGDCLSTYATVSAYNISITATCLPSSTLWHCCLLQNSINLSQPNIANLGVLSPNQHQTYVVWKTT